MFTHCREMSSALFPLLGTAVRQVLMTFFAVQRILVAFVRDAGQCGAWCMCIRRPTSPGYRLL